MCPLPGAALFKIRNQQSFLELLKGVTRLKPNSQFQILYLNIKLAFTDFSSISLCIVSFRTRNLQFLVLLGSLIASPEIHFDPHDFTPSLGCYKAHTMRKECAVHCWTINAMRLEYCLELLTPSSKQRRGRWYFFNDAGEKRLNTQQTNQKTDGFSRRTGGGGATASGRSSEKLSLPALQSKMKCDPEGYESELLLLLNQFNSSLELFQQQAKMNFTSITGIGTDPTVAKDLGDRAMFLAHVTPFYPNHLADFPLKLADLLRSAARTLPSGLRCHLTQALILLVNRKFVDVGETLSLFMELQTLGDRTLKKLAFDHVIHSIRRMNQKHKNEAKNRALQNVLFTMLQQEDEERAKRALVTLCELHRRKVWFDERTANAICTASFHPASRIMIAALSFLLDYEKLLDNEDSDDSSSDDELTKSPQVILSKETVYKVRQAIKVHQLAKRKRKPKLQRVIRSMKRRQHQSSERRNNNYYSPLNHLKDAQGFAEKLFSRLQKCNERFEVPPDAVEPLFKQIAITVGLNAVREICMRMPLLMNEDLLQDLALYKKSHEKAVSVAARSLIALFREICPSLLVKKDRGRPVDPKARPKAFGEVNVATDVPGAELLQTVDDSDEGESGDSDDLVSSGSDDDQENDQMSINDDDENQLCTDDTGSDEAEDGDLVLEDEDEKSSDYETDSDQADEEDEVSEHEEDNDLHTFSDDGSVETKSALKETAKKRKFTDFNGQLLAADTSLRVLKKMAGTKVGHALPESKDGILSNEDFQRIKELKAKKEARIALAQHGLAKSAAIKVPSSDQLSLKRVDGTMLEVHVRKKMSKDERLALVKAGREERGKYYARTAVKQKKTGGLSNRQKEHKKKMPLAAKRDKVARSRTEKRKNNSGPANSSVGGKRGNNEQ
ncbi:hypothetical protein SESBI_12883 [Sesbania bispinosa]|nr:hypothetical protein SESBI_12883 [Sesbania bispinosa]